MNNQLPFIGKTDHCDLANVLHVSQHLRSKCVNIYLTEETLELFVKYLLSFVYSDLKSKYLVKTKSHHLSSNLIIRHDEMKSNRIRLFFQKLFYRIRSFYFKLIWSSSNKRIIDYTIAHNILLTLKNSQKFAYLGRSNVLRQEIIFES